MEKKLIIDLLSDTHNQHNRFTCPGGDILLHSGDVSSRGTDMEILNFINWFEQQKYEFKIFIPGNHDWSLEKNFAYWKDECDKRRITLLNDSGIIIKSMDDPNLNLRVWGSPVQPWFHSWAFNRHRTQKEATFKHPWIKPHWDAIPEHTEILLTHGPPMGILDEVLHINGTSYDPPNNVGCEELLKRIKETQIKLHVFGHIHCGRGFLYHPEITYVNGSALDEMYCSVSDKPMRITREIVQDGSVVYIL